MDKLNSEEQWMMEDLEGIQNQILDWKLLANHSELIAAVHVIQGFVVQHMLQRELDGWSHWFEENGVLS